MYIVKLCTLTIILITIFTSSETYTCRPTYTQHSANKVKQARSHKITYSLSATTQCICNRLDALRWGQVLLQSLDECSDAHNVKRYGRMDQK